MARSASRFGARLSCGHDLFGYALPDEEPALGEFIPCVACHLANEVNGTHTDPMVTVRDVVTSAPLSGR